MTSAEHLIENLIYGMKRGATCYDILAEPCNVANLEDAHMTGEEAIRIVDHVVWSLYDGKYPDCALDCKDCIYGKANDCVYLYVNSPVAVQNQKTKENVVVKEGDIFYCYYSKSDSLDEDGRLIGDWCQATKRVWSFPCQGVLKLKGKSYILGPGSVMYQLGVDCFRSAVEARTEFYSQNRRVGGCHERKKYRVEIVELKEEEKIKI